jgi:Zn-dependent protease with chaperone function
MVTLIIVEMSLRIWQVETPRERFRYRLQVLILPFIMYPLFQMLNPERGSFYFIEDSAVFSSIRWLGIDMFGLIPVYVLFLLVVAVITVLAFTQEIIPVARHLSGKGGGRSGRPADDAISGMVEEMSRNLRIGKPSVYVIEDSHPVIYTAGTKDHAIILSEPLVKVFDMRQMRNALAHELAHIARMSNFTTLIVFMVRLCMFYNPISLLEFRKLVQDDEHICDDITVSVTRDPVGLASALKVFFIDIQHEGGLKVSALKDAIESSSHNLLLKERIERLENNGSFVYHPFRWGRYSLTLSVVLTVNYFVV